MVVEKHPTLLNVTLHPAKVGQGHKVKNQKGHRRRPRPSQPFSAHPLWRDRIISPGGGGGGSSGHGVSNSTNGNSNGDNVAGNGIRLVGSGGDRGEIGHSDGDGGGEVALTENYVKGQDTPRMPVEPYTYYSPGHHEITDIPYHSSNDDALHIRVAHDTLGDWYKAMRSGSIEAKSLTQILYFAAPLFSFQVLL
jgi:hypothetical protein